MATLISHLKIFPGKEREFERVARQMYLKTQGEPGCHRYEYYRREEPGHYFSFEIFADYHAFVQHLAAPYHEAADWPSLLEAVRVEWLDPVAGASSAGPTDEKRAPPDAGEVLRKCYELYRVRATWWQALR